VRQANTFFHDEYPGHGSFRDGRRRVAAETSAFTRCLRTFLRGEADAPKLEVELKELGFTPTEVAGYMAAGNRQVYALGMLGSSIRNAKLSPMERTAMDETLSKLMDDVGACERIFKTPIPTVYTGHTSRFTGTWLLLLPFALYSVDPSWNHLVSIPSTFFVTFFLLGIEELGLQIEEPFSILPIEAYCDGSIGAPILDMVLAEDQARKREKHAAAAAEQLREP
jgi:putative membrane protein